MLATAAAIFSALLIVTGVAKLMRPHDVEAALSALGIPRLRGIGWTMGLLEVAVGVGALLVNDVLWVQAVFYVAFAGWVALALRAKVPIASCGCLGRPDTPPTSYHLFLDVLAAFVSVGAAIGQPMPLDVGLPLFAQLVVILAGSFLSYIVLSDLAHLVGVRRQ